MRKAVVLTSGGQDSTTCLAWAIEKFGRDNILPVTFNYGQRHFVEVACAQYVCDYFGIKQPYMIDVPALRDFGAAALTNLDIEVEAQASEKSENQFAHDHGLPSTFVPGRNMIFLSLAAAYGAQHGSYHLVTGVCEADAAGYPDCRAIFIEKAEDALTAALDDEPVTIHAPLLKRSKAGTWSMAEDLGVLDLIIHSTHTCYNGVHNEENLHEWGYGCAACPACAEREKGFIEFKQMSVA